MAKSRTKKNSNSIELHEIQPLNDRQREVLDSDKNLILCGSAGTGKTFLSCYLAMSHIYDREFCDLVIARSAVPTRDIGFLPGTDKEKTRVYEEPYYAIFSELFHRGDAYELMKQNGYVDFITTSYLRGLTLRNSIILLDEAQNLTAHELDSLITRVGHNCKVIICGDFKQADLAKNGLKQFLNIIKEMPNDFDIIEFGTEDIVRSGLVKRYIETKERLDGNNIAA